MFQVRAPQTPRPSTDRTWTLLTRGGAVLLAVLLVAFGVLYWTDQRTPESPSMNSRAIAQAEAAVRRTPNSVPARLSLASAYELDKRYDDALSQIDQVLRLDRGNRLALLGRGYALYLKGDLQPAADAYRRVVDQHLKGEFAGADKQLQEAHYYLGTILVKQHKIPEAKKELTAALKIDPTDADALYQLGVAELAGGDASAAITDFQRALAFVPTGWADPWSQLATAYTKTGDDQRAAWSAGMSAAAAGKPAQARQQLSGIANGNGRKGVRVDAMIGLATLAQTEGRRDEAIAWYGKALSIDPRNAGAKAALDELKGATGHAATGGTGEKEG